MPTRWILVADPPHGDTKVLELAKRLELVALEVRGRLGYPIPDPWLVVADEAAARTLEKDLEAHGVHCVAVQAGELARVPAAVEADSFDLPDGGLAFAQRQGAKGALAWGEVRSLVLYRRVIEDEGGASEHEKKTADRLRRASNVARYMPGGRLVAGALGGAARDIESTAGGKAGARFDEVLELAGVGAQGPQRARFVKSEVHFTGLGALRQPVGHANWMTFVKLVAERATNARLDRRGDKVQPRPLTTLQKVGLHKVFTGVGPPLKTIVGDPLEFFGAFVAWRAGVLAGPAGP